MSAVLNVKFVCDTCRSVIAESDGRASDGGFFDAMYELRAKLTQLRGLEVKLMRRPTKHYCQTCADGAPKEKARKP